MTRYRGSAQTLFSYDSAASHVDAHLRDIAWCRENAVLALGSSASPPSSFSRAPDLWADDNLFAA